MYSKHYLDVKIGSKSALVDQKQKSFESYDSTSSNYSQVSDSSDIPSPLQRLETIKKSPPNQMTHATSDPCSNSSQAQIKRTFWQKTVSSFRSYRHIGNNLKRHKSIACPSTSPTSPGSFDMESDEIDPVYHLLRCAATQGKCKGAVCDESTSQLNLACTERSRSLSGSQFHNSRSQCIDPKCPCKFPDRIPVIKKEDLGQIGKKNQLCKCVPEQRKFSSKL